MLSSMFQPRRALLWSLLSSLPVSVFAAYGSGSKGKFMSAYPAIFKFVLFWWCVFVFVVMGFYIADHLLWRKFGPAKVTWKAERVLKAAPAGGRQAYWQQLVDPTRWTDEHPVIQSADIRMVKCDEDEAKEVAAGATGEESKDDSKEERKEEDSKEKEEAVATTKTSKQQTAGENGDTILPSNKAKPVGLQRLKVGYGFILRHKMDAGGPRAGSFFCTRKCTVLEEPADGTWRMVMRTVETGNGYPFEEDSEESEVLLEVPHEENGSVKCTISGSASVTSRLFRWWNGLEPNSRAASESMLEAIETIVLATKKKE